MSDPELRRMAAADAERGVALVRAAFAHADREAGREPKDLSEARVRTFVGRLANFTATDPDGCWVAEDDEGLAGLTVAIRRGGLWGLALLFVRPGLQGRGLGGRLLERSRATAEGAAVEVIESSEDPRAIRRYAGLGLSLHPAMALRGTPDRSRLPADGDVRDGTADDLDLVEAVDTELRGAGATRVGDVAFMLEGGAELLVVDAGASRGFAVASTGHPACLGATDDATAARLLLSVLARGEDDATVEVEGVTASQGWAFRAALSAGLRLAPTGPMFLRGWPAFPGPYLPSGVYF